MAIIGALAIAYSINLLFTSVSQSETVNAPPVLRVKQWSGYIVNLHGQNSSDLVASVSASWIVPSVKPSENNTFSSVWVGVGGYGEKTLIQAGTEQEFVDGRAYYFAWYELLPAYMTRITTMRVQPGDMVSVAISLVNANTNTWLIEVNDVTRGGRFQKTVVYNSSRLSAEWIVERPNVDNVTSTLANFGNVTFTDCKATIGGKTGVIGNFSYAQLVMVDPQDKPFVEVSSLDSFGSSFTVRYLEPASVEQVHTEAVMPSLICTNASPRSSRKVNPAQLEAIFDA
ncbi:MAG: G1 family endopeptidase [Candidatus Bathyarchaeota archaeon]|nr:G1 family endopeptidase [Candidatus Bathyarchaeota archaeon]